MTNVEQRNTLGSHKQATCNKLFYQELPHGVVLSLAEGTGYHSSGREAADVATGYLAQFQDITIDNIEDLNAILNDINNLVLAHSNDHNDLHCLSATIALAFVVDSTAFWAHLGDTHIYLFRNGTLQKITNKGSKTTLKKKGFCSVPVKSAHGRLALKENDILLFLSGGVHHTVPVNEILTILQQDSSLHEKANQLDERAHQQGYDETISLLLYSY